MSKFTDLILRPEYEMEVIVDLETTQRAPSPLFSADPHYYENAVLLVGWKIKSAGTTSWGPTQTGTVDDLERSTRCSGRVLYIGHNIRFDAHYIERRLPCMFLGKADLWDTAITCYLLSGQTNLFPSLEDAAQQVHCSLHTKYAPVSEMIKAGKIEEVSKEELQTYLEQDIELTYEVYKRQQTVLREYSATFRSLVHIQQMAMNLYYGMEDLGLLVDKDKLLKLSDDLTTKYKVYEEAIKVFVSHIFPEHPDPTLEYTSKYKLFSSAFYSHVFFGTSMPIIAKVKVGHYKNGKVKYKQTQLELERSPDYPVVGYVSLTVSKTAKGTYNVDEDSLKKIQEGSFPHHVALGELAKLELDRRAVQKELDYVNDWINRIDVYKDNVLRPNINSCATRTGRTSSSKPNAQNVPPSLRECVVPGDGNVMVAADFKQLEVCGLAELSADPTLLEDIKNKEDIHANVGGSFFSGTMTVEERRQVKGVVFGTIYGGGVATLSKQTGLPSGVVQKVQKAFFDRYDTLKDYYETVRHTISPDATVYKDGHKLKRGQYVLKTGRKLEFEQELSFRFGSSPKPEWPYSKIRNYPVQAFSTGDLVPAWAALLYVAKTYLMEENFFSPMILIHDEIVVECKKDRAEDTQDLLVALGEVALPELYLEWTGMELKCPLTVETKVGNNWKEVK